MMRSAEQSRPDVVITAGATSEPIDDVRSITNFSSGGLGHALACEYAKYGGNIVLLSPKITVQKYGEITGVAHRTFTTAEDLRQQLLGIEGAGIVLQAAAVSDYTPARRAEGKLSSNPERITIELQRTQKILPQLRDHFGAETTIIGFKLLSGVSEAELVTTGLRQIRSAHTDYCVANDLQQLSGNQRVVHIIDSDGTYQSETGTTQEVAAQIVNTTSRDHIYNLQEGTLSKRAIFASRLADEEGFVANITDRDKLTEITREIESAMIAQLQQSSEPLLFADLCNAVFDGYPLPGFGLRGQVWVLCILGRLRDSGWVVDVTGGPLSQESRFITGRLV